MTHPPAAPTSREIEEIARRAWELTPHGWPRVVLLLFCVLVLAAAASHFVWMIRRWLELRRRAHQRALAEAARARWPGEHSPL